MEKMRIGMKGQCAWGLAVAVAAALVPPLSAQEARPPIGRIVRVVLGADGSVHDGRVILAAGDTVVLQRNEHQEWIALGPRDRVEVAARRKSHPLAGALIGAGVGAFLGTVAGRLQGMVSCTSLEPCPPPSNPDLDQASRAAIGGLLGITLGALTGSHVYTTEWTAVPRPGGAAFPRRAEALARLPYGEWVRLTSPTDGAVYQGTLEYGVADTLVLERGGRQVWIGLDSLDRLEVRKSSRSFAVIGAVAGAAVGAALGSTSSRHQCSGGPIIIGETIVRYCGLSSASGAVVFGSIGMAAGALVGSQVRVAVWEPTPGDPPGSLRLTVAPLPDGGLALGASVAF